MAAALVWLLVRRAGWLPAVISRQQCQPATKRHIERRATATATLVSSSRQLCDCRRRCYSRQILTVAAAAAAAICRRLWRAPHFHESSLSLARLFWLPAQNRKSLWRQRRRRQRSQRADAIWQQGEMERHSFGGQSTAAATTTTTTCVLACCYSITREWRSPQVARRRHAAGWRRRSPVASLAADKRSAQTASCKLQAASFRLQTEPAPQPQVPAS